MSNSPLAVSELIDLFDRWSLGVEYQPLVCTRSGETRAFEALARFRVDGRLLSPLQVFEGLHACAMTLFQVELAVTRLQLAKRPSDALLFVNLDPHAAAAYGTLNPRNPLIDALVGAPELVVELIENTSVADAVISEQLLAVFREAGQQLAIDDLGAPDSLVSLPVLMGVDYLKFDRRWLRERRNSQGIALMKALLSYARDTGKKTVLEGVEDAEDLRFASELGVDWVQGYRFRERFITEWG